MIIDVKVKTGQREQQIAKDPNGGYKISVKSLPTKNQANREVIQLLAKHFGVSQSDVKIKGGKFSSRKRIYIDEQIRIGY